LSLPSKGSLITETLVSVITKAVLVDDDDDGGQQLVAVKAGKAKKKLVLEPHDIVKELRLLSSLSHPAVRLHTPLLCRHSSLAHARTDNKRLGPRLRPVAILTTLLDALHAIYARRPPLYPYLFPDYGSGYDE
jgi:hypothetical protein